MPIVRQEASLIDQLAPFPRNDRVRVWDLPLRLFHWILVVAIATAFLSAEEDSPLSQWHILSGWIAGVLIAFRLVWGVVGGEHSRFASFIRPAAVGHHMRNLVRGRTEPSVGHNPLGGLSAVLLLLLVAAAVFTGATMGLIWDGEIHEMIGWSLLALVLVHVAAVICMSILSGENLIQAMIVGTKHSARHPGVRDARAPGIFAILLGLLAIAGSAVAIRVYDPQAFTLRSTESFEHRTEGGGHFTRVEERSASRDEDD